MSKSGTPPKGWRHVSSMFLNRPPQESFCHVRSFYFYPRNRFLTRSRPRRPNKNRLSSSARLVVVVHFVSKCVFVKWLICNIYIYICIIVRVNYVYMYIYIYLFSYLFICLFIYLYIMYVMYGFATRAPSLRQPPPTLQALPRSHPPLQLLQSLQDA